MPYSIDPQVAGELGDGTVLDSTVHPPSVSQVEFILDYPETDDIVQSFPVYLVTSQLAARIEQAEMVGIVLADAIVRPSEEYVAAFGDAPHRSYRWLQPVIVDAADAWIDSSLQLCVSDRMMSVLEGAVLSDCVATEIDG